MLFTLLALLFNLLSFSQVSLFENDCVVYVCVILHHHLIKAGTAGEQNPANESFNQSAANDACWDRGSVRWVMRIFSIG